MKSENLGYPVFLLRGPGNVVLLDSTVNTLFVPAGTTVLKAYLVVDRDMNDNTASATVGDAAAAAGWRAATGLDAPVNTRGGTLDSDAYYAGKHYTAGTQLTSAVVFTGDGIGVARFHVEALCVKMK